MTFPRITSRPDVCTGKPCIRDLRFPVSRLLGLLAAGQSREEILRAYPYLESADIDEALLEPGRPTDPIQEGELQGGRPRRDCRREKDDGTSRDRKRHVNDAHRQQQPMEGHDDLTRPAAS